MEKLEFDKLLKIGGFKTKKEFANLFELNPKSVNNWGTSQNIPYWVESWLNNYIEAKEFRDTLQKDIGVDLNWLAADKKEPVSNLIARYTQQSSQKPLEGDDINDTDDMTTQGIIKAEKEAKIERMGIELEKLTASFEDLLERVEKTETKDD